MVKLKNKIKQIDNIQIEKKKINILPFIIIFIIILLLTTFIYIKYLSKSSINLDNIVGKKIYITKCKTKDYIYIYKDKTYTLLLTNDNCIQNEYNGNIVIKKNKIYLNNIEIKIDKDNNIIINNNTFKGENNE